jgi:hypothetical protein
LVVVGADFENVSLPLVANAIFPSLVDDGAEWASDDAPAHADDETAPTTP